MAADGDAKVDILATGEVPPSKKVKSGPMEQAPDGEWPEAWLMVPDGDIEDQKAPNRLVPNVPVSAEELREIGIW